jgi:dihydrofolate synthase / folylpolyglutamate synthase
MTYDEAIAFWFGRINYEVRSAAPKDLKLERMRALLRLLGDPHDRLRIVHITGTKGKGSTAAMLAAVLEAAGYRVGLFTSPHLVHVEERIRVNEEPISHEELVARIEEIAPAVKLLENGPSPLTFFEISTALGFLHFVRRRVDVAVVEVGLGGRYDSTNVCQPLVSVVTSIGSDHTAQLGTTLEEIAYQKAGIIKPRVPVVSGVTQEESRKVIRKIAAELGAPLTELWEHFGFDYCADGATPRVTVCTPRETIENLRVSLLGAHQAANAAVAVAIGEVLRDAGLSLPESAIRKGLQTVRWPARIEVVSRRPAVILDTAHNVPSAEALVNTLQQSVPVPGRKSVVFAVSSDKQYPEILRVLAGYFDHFHLTKYGNNPRCVPPEKLAEVLHQVSPVAATVHPTAIDAWQAARSAVGAEDLVCVTGSVFLAGELQSSVRSEGESPFQVNGHRL